MYFKKREAGFTLIELLVVIAIIGMLSSVVLASLSNARRKGRDTRRLVDVRQLATALEQYANDNGGYPGTGQWYDNSCDPGYTDFGPLISSYYTMPADPGGRCMWYFPGYTGSGTWKYIITFAVESNDTLTKDFDCYGPTQWYCIGMK